MLFFGSGNAKHTARAVAGASPNQHVDERPRRVRLHLRAENAGGGA